MEGELLENDIYFNIALYLMEFFVGIPVISFIIYTLVKSVKQFIQEGDIRFVFLVQSYIYLIAVVTESILYMVLGCANDFCIISFKIFVLLNTFNYAQTKFTGHIMVKVPRLARGTLYTTILTFFWSIVFFFAMTTESTYIFTQDLLPYEKLDQIVFFMGREMNGNGSSLQILISSIMPFVFVSSSLIVDAIEKKSSKIILNGVAYYIPATINLLLLIDGKHSVINVCLLLVMVFITCCIMTRECYLIVYVDDSSLSEKLAERLYKEIKTERNAQNIVIKKKMAIRSFSEQDISSFKSKRLQENFRKLLQSSSETKID